jgi:Uma2 family endonuclease
MDGAAKVAYRTYRFTVSDFLRMDEAGVFAREARVELIEGEIVEMAPIGSLHAATVAFLHRRLVEGLGRRAVIWGQSPVVLDEFSAPQPDIAVLVPRSDHYRNSHPRPADILLMIEVADTTLAFDRDKKAPLYARSGIAELWIVDVERSAVHVFRDPQGERYASEQVVVAPPQMGIAAFPDLVVDLSGFFPQ